MNLKKNWKRFWTLSRSREGFTLVELIVVIAILAILAGVAVPAYSGYVTKANKQADITLASEVAHALTLYYYAHPEENASGFVVLNREGVASGSYASNEAMTAAMDAVFGDGWEQNLSLSYENWTAGGSAVGEALMLGRYGEAVANSSYMTNTTPAELLNEVQQVVLAASNYFENMSPENSYSVLRNQIGADRLEQLCEEYGISTLKNADGTAYAFDNANEDQLSNMLVFGVASVIDEDPALAESSAVVTRATTFAGLAAYYFDNQENEAVAGAYNTMMTQINDLGAGASAAALDHIFNNFKATCNASTNTGTTWDTYAATQQNATNADAFTGIMQSVNNFRPNLTDKNLANDQYFTSTDLVDQLENYASTAKIYASDSEVDWMMMDDIYDNNAVVIFLNPGPDVQASNAEVFAG